jgi:PAS domain S-box-containing protein
MEPTDPLLDNGTSLLKGRIAELERELELMRQSEEDLRLLAENAHDYAFITFDAGNRVRSWNTGAVNLLGYTGEEIRGQSGVIFFTPEDRATNQPEREMEQARREGRGVNERWHLCKDGTRFWGSGLVFPLWDRSGKLRGYGKIMRDLTLRKEATDNLRESEERFRLLTGSLTEWALFQVNPEGLISFWNPGAERLFGYREDELMGKGFAILFPEEDAGYAERELSRALAQGSLEDERWLVRKDGSRFFARWVTNLVHDSHGNLRGFLKLLRDETSRNLAEQAEIHRIESERQRLQGQLDSAGTALDRTKEELRALAASLLKAQEEERRRLARELHDDFAQRLALLELELSKLRLRLPSSPGEIQVELNRLEGLAGTLSDDVRQLSHRLHPAQLDELGLVAAIRQLVEDFETLRDEPVRFEAREDGWERLPAEVSAALYRIAQEALRNILKHSARGLVRVAIAGAPGEVHLTIEDGGPGFDPASTKGRGGLGLISMQERAELAGGRFRLRSRPGSGTTIEVVAPVSGRVP